MQSNATAVPGLADKLKGWLTWFAGAVTGIAALFYAVGYLSLRAHADLLGLVGFVQFDHDELLQEGARFFVVAGAAIAQAVLTATAALTALGLLMLALRHTLRRIPVWPRVQAFAARCAPNVRRVAFVLVGLFFLWTLWDDIDAMRNPLCVTNALYRAPDVSACPKGYDAQTLIANLQDGTSQALRKSFSDLLFSGLGHALFLTGLAGWLARPWATRRWLVVPFLLAVALMSLLLPMVYGVMVTPVRYPRIALALADHSTDGRSLYLLRRDDKGLTVWDPTRRVLIWWPLSAILRADVEGVDNPLAFASKGKQ